jgi:hypothetical protein
VFSPVLSPPEPDRRCLLRNGSVPVARSYRKRQTWSSSNCDPDAALVTIHFPLRSLFRCKPDKVDPAGVQHASDRSARTATNITARRRRPAVVLVGTPTNVRRSRSRRRSARAARTPPAGLLIRFAPCMTQCTSGERRRTPHVPVCLQFISLARRDGHRA